MAITVNEASAVLREAVRDTIRKRSLLVLIQGSVMVAAGVLALIFPAFMSTSLLVLLGWLLILSGIVQVISLFGATQVPYFWMQIITIALEVLVGFLLVNNPEAGLLTVTLLMLVLFLVGGVARVVFAADDPADAGLALGAGERPRGDRLRLGSLRKSAGNGKLAARSPARHRADRRRRRPSLHGLAPASGRSLIGMRSATQLDREAVWLRRP